MSEELHRAIGRVEGKLDSFLYALGKSDERHDKMDTRVAKVESKVHWFSGAAAVIGAVAGYLIPRWTGQA